MINLNASVSIDRPIKQVFEFVSTAENDLRWQYGTLESARVGTGSFGVGTFFRSIFHVMDRRLLGTFEITEYETNHRYGFKSLSGPLQSETHYTFEIADGSTRINVSSKVTAAASFEIHEGTFEKHLKKQLKENLAMLKGILESL